MTECKDEERPGDAGLNLRVEPAQSRREAHPTSRQFEIRPGKIVAEGVKAQLLDLTDVHGGHVASRTDRPSQSLMGADTQQESAFKRLSLLSACRDRQRNRRDEARDPEKPVATQDAVPCHRIYHPRNDASPAATHLKKASRGPIAVPRSARLRSCCRRGVRH